MLAAHLKQILSDKALVSNQTGHSVTLKEAGVMEVEITKIGSDAVVINLNKFGSFSGIKDGECKQVCDYMLVFPPGQEDRVIFVELKKTVKLKKTLYTKEIKPFDQLRRSLPILKYLDAVCKIHFPASEKDHRKISIRYVLIAERINARFDKQPLRPDRTLLPEKYEDIEVTRFVSKRIRFERLWSQ